MTSTSGGADGPLRDKVVIVTGSTRGIGRATAVRAGQQGARVTVTGRTEDHGKEVVTTIEELGGDAYFVRTVLRLPAP